MGEQDIFKIFFDNSAIGMSMTSPGGSISTNKAFRDLLGYTAEEFANVKWMDLTHPDDIANDKVMLGSILAGERSTARWQKRYLHKSGKIVWADINTAIQRDTDENPHFFITTVTDTTEQVYLQNAIRKSEAMLQESQRIAKLGTYDFNLETGFWTSSEILDEIFGITRDYNRSLAGWAQIIHPEWQQEMVDYVNNEVVGNRKPFDKEYKIVKVSTQEERWLHGRGIVESDAAGNPLRLIGTITDITDRKLVEIDALETQKRVNRERDAMAAMAIDAVVSLGDIPLAMSRITRLVTEVTRVERASVWLLSKDGQELKCLSLFERSKLCHSEGMILLAADYPRYFEALSKGASISADNARLDPRTSEFNEGYLKPLGITSMMDVGIILNGELAGVICLESIGERRIWKSDEEAFASTMASIAAQVFINAGRRKAEEALKESQERYRLLMETLPDSVIVHSEGRIVYANPASAKVIGADSSVELVGMPVMNLVHPDYHKMAIQRIRESIASGNPLPIAEERLIRLDGLELDVEVTAVPLSFNGQSAMLTVTNDITARKRAALILKQNTEIIQAQNEEYQQLNEELNQTNEALVHAVERAEESDRLKSAFLANMSHEIRTPLNSIIGFSELLREEENEPDEVVRFSSIINASGNHLLQLVTDLIDISKIESGTEQVRAENLLPYQAIREIVSQFRLMSVEKSVNIIDNIPHGIRDLSIQSDPKKLRQILTNLVSNALKFTKEGYVEIGFEEQQNGVLFFVKDTGIGISEDQLSRIFNRFYQVDSSYQRQFEGAGLGLSLCKGMVELLGGKIWVESQVGVGSKFSFVLPTLN